MDRHQTFRSECEAAGFVVEHYRGRFFYEGPAVRCESEAEYQDVMRATTVRVQRDQLGRGWIVYPA